MAERSAKIASYPVLKVFRRYASFRVPLVLLSLLVNLFAFRNSGFSLLRTVYTFGLDGPSRIHSDHLSRGGDSRKRSFSKAELLREVSVKLILSSLARFSESSTLLKRLARNGFSQAGRLLRFGPSFCLLQRERAQSG